MMINNEFFLFFILAHLIGDYVLQTDKIALKKSQGIQGVAVHTLLVCLSQLVLLAYFGVKGIVAALLGAGIHFLIDCLKLALGKRLGKIELLYYFIDQGLHLSVIWLLTVIFAPEKGTMDPVLSYVRLVIGLILLTYMSTVTVKNVVRHFFPELKQRRFFEKGERWIDAIPGVGLLISYLIHPAIFILFLIIGAFLYKKSQKAVFQYSLPVSLVKYSTLALFAFFVVLFVVA